MDTFKKMAVLIKQDSYYEECYAWADNLSEREKMYFDTIMQKSAEHSYHSIIRRLLVEGEKGALIHLNDSLAEMKGEIR